MANKQLSGSIASDGSSYGALTDGAGNLVVISTVATGSTKQLTGAKAPDGSTYFTLTNGSGILV